jgi:hypothetical protein
MLLLAFKSVELNRLAVTITPFDSTAVSAKAVNIKR